MTGGRLHVFFRKTLVVVEVALALMLLAAAGLMIRTVAPCRMWTLASVPIAC